MSPPSRKGLQGKEGLESKSSVATQTLCYHHSCLLNSSYSYNPPASLTGEWNSGLLTGRGTICRLGGANLLHNANLVAPFPIHDRTRKYKMHGLFKHGPKNHQYWIWRFCWVDLFPKGRLKQDRGEVQGEFYARAGQKVGSNCPTHFLNKFLGSRWRSLGLFGSRWLGSAGSREVGLVEGEESVGIYTFCLSLCWSSVFNLREGWPYQIGWIFGKVPKGGRSFSI